MLIYSSKDGELVVLLLSTANNIHSSNTWAVHTELDTAHALEPCSFECCNLIGQNTEFIFRIEPPMRFNIVRCHACANFDPTSL